MSSSSNLLAELFQAKQREMLAVLQGARKAMSHPVMKGSATERNWRNLLQQYLPERYQVGTGKIMDSSGSESDQIDAVIFDRQYSPLLFETDEDKYIPAESVYCVFEVRQDLNVQNLKYTAEKIASVRRLLRTSAPITHAGGRFEPRDPLRILGGILTTQSSWKPPFGQALNNALADLTNEAQIDLGCALADGVFVADYDRGLKITHHESPTSLVAFVFELLSKLQPLGTVPAIDYRKYLRGAQQSFASGSESSD